MIVARSYSYPYTPPFSGILDSIGGAAGAWSVDRISTDYTGALCRVRRSSDNAETDVNPDELGGYRISLSSTVSAGGTLGSWLGSDNMTVVYWYGQETAGTTGAGNDAGQGISGRQPLLATAGVLQTDPNNGHVALLFDGTDDHFNFTAIAATQNFYQHLLFNRASSGIKSFGISGSGTRPYPFLWWTDNAIYSDFGTTTAHDTGQTQTGTFLQTSLRDSSNNLKQWQNGSAKTTKTVSGTTGSFTYLGGRAISDVGNGCMQELIFWNSDQESNRSTIETNANTRFA